MRAQKPRRCKSAPGKGRGACTLQHGINRDPAPAARADRLAHRARRGQPRSGRSAARAAACAVSDVPWHPSATRSMLERRAALLASLRRFFAARGVLEVDTPFLVNHPVSDVHIHSARVTLADEEVHFLHTSPEYAMKRLLAAGSGDIFQICHVVRAFERSRLHNPEFTLLEWYRIGFSLDDL